MIAWSSRHWSLHTPFPITAIGSGNDEVYRASPLSIGLVEVTWPKARSRGHRFKNAEANRSSHLLQWYEDHSLLWEEIHRIEVQHSGIHSRKSTKITPLEWIQLWRRDGFHSQTKWSLIWLLKGWSFSLALRELHSDLRRFLPVDMEPRFPRTLHALKKMGRILAGLNKNYRDCKVALVSCSSFTCSYCVPLHRCHCNRLLLYIFKQ